MGHFSVCGMILDVDECSFCLNLGGLRHSAGISYVYVRIRPQKHLDIVFLICPSPTLSSSSCNLALRLPLVLLGVSTTSFCLGSFLFPDYQIMEVYVAGFSTLFLRRVRTNRKHQGSVRRSLVIPE